jgi:hypothetical protein
MWKEQVDISGQLWVGGIVHDFHTPKLEEKKVCLKFVVLPGMKYGDQLEFETLGIYGVVLRKLLQSHSKTIILQRKPPENYLQFLPVSFLEFRLLPYY